MYLGFIMMVKAEPIYQQVLQRPKIEMYQNAVEKLITTSVFSSMLSH